MAFRSVFYHLLKQSAARTRLVAELDAAAAAGQLADVPTHEQGAALPYLQACLKEAVRLHPGLTFLFERVVPPGGAELCAYTLPKGAVVGVSPFVLHFDRVTYGDDVDAFRPERWLEADHDRLKRMEDAFMAVRRPLP